MIQQHYDPQKLHQWLDTAKLKNENYLYPPERLYKDSRQADAINLNLAMVDERMHHVCRVINNTKQDFLYRV